MKPPTNGNIPLIGQNIKKTMPMEPFHIDGLGWFNPDATITSEHLSHLLIILITLISPKPPNVVFKLEEYGKEHDLIKYFTSEKPASMKQLEADNQRIAKEMQQIN